MRYVVKRYWQFCDSVEVEAHTPDQAIERAHEMPLDESRGEYVMGSLNSDPLEDVEPLTERGAS